MPRFRNYQTNFSGGLLSEGMLGRLDLAQYENGCKQLDNFWPKITGGMRRRPGTLFLADVDGNSTSVTKRIESFVFNEDQVYIIAFATQNVIRIYDEDGSLIDKLNTSFSLTEATIREMSVTQKGDVMFLAHQSWHLQKLVRESATTWALYDFEFDGVGSEKDWPKKMPFIKFAPGEMTIKVNGFKRETDVTITASSAYWFQDHVGTTIRYRGKQIVITNVPLQGEGPIYDATTTCTGRVKEDLDRSQQLAFGGSDDAQDFDVGEIIVGRESGTKAEVISVDAFVGPTRYLTGYITVALLGGKFSATTVEDVEGLDSGNVVKISGATLIDPVATTNWDEEVFNAKRGWPSVAEFHSQRLWLGGSSSLPAHIFGSRVAAFFDFDVGDAFPADSIQVAIAGNQISRVTDIVSGRHLQIFTDAGEFYAPQSEDRPLVPEDFNLLKQTGYGTRANIRSKVFDESTLFMQAQGSAVREFIWQDRQRGYSSDAVSLIVDEYLNDVQEIEVLYGGYDRPEQLAFFVNADGTIIWYHAARSEQIRSWGRWTTQGNFKSLAVVQDKLYALVERNGIAFLERFELDVTLDHARQYTGTDESVWTLPIFLEGLTVQATSGETAHNADFYVGEFDVEGIVILVDIGDGFFRKEVVTGIDISPIKRDNLTIGFGFEQVIETMPIEVKDRSGVTTGLPKRLVSADLYIASTLAVQLEGNVVLTFVGEDDALIDLSQKPSEITGVRKFYLLGYDERPTLEVRNAVPLACEVLALGAEVEY